MFNDGKYGRIDADHWLFSEEQALRKEVGEDVVYLLIGDMAERKWYREETGQFR